MDALFRDLAIGATGSVIGAAIVYFASSAVSFSKSAKTRAEEKRNLEIEMWKTRKIQVRMEITNYYLFEVLKAFLFGTILTIIPSIVTFSIANFVEFRILWPILAGITFLGLGYYFIGLGHVIRYIKIRRSDEDYLKTYVATPPET